MPTIINLFKGDKTIYMYMRDTKDSYRQVVICPSEKYLIYEDAGVSYDIQAAPIVLALDFRPGYGLMFNDGANASFFDWKLAFAVRYRF